jgi:hypothetical protein
MKSERVSPSLAERLLTRSNAWGESLIWSRTFPVFGRPEGRFSCFALGGAFFTFLAKFFAKIADNGCVHKQI